MICDSQDIFNDANFALLGAYCCRLKQEKRYEQGALSFTCDKGQLLNTIQHFGKLCHANASLHSRNEAFHASLELDDCEAISTTSEVGQWVNIFITNASC